MSTDLFSSRSLWAMLHGVVFGGAALLALFAALFAVWAARPRHGLPSAEPSPSHPLARLMVFAAAVIWIGTLVGLYIVFPIYRATPPEGADLMTYPRAFLLADPDTAWLHAFGMEIKEHVPVAASMLTTAVAFVAVRYRSLMLDDAPLRRMSMTLLAVSFLLTVLVAVLGVLINKVAPIW